jgi:hypothetical protein
VKCLVTKQVTSLPAVLATFPLKLTTGLEPTATESIEVVPEVVNPVVPSLMLVIFAAIGVILQLE